MTALVLSAAVALAGFEASSVRPDAKRGAAYWGAGAALDGKLDSCWMINPEAENAGSWLALDVAAGTVDKVAFVIGWDKDDNSFKDYARAKVVRIEVIDSGNGDAVKVDEKFSLEDKRGWQIIDIPDAKVGSEYKGGRVRVTVLEVFPGHDYQNLAMSEMRVHMGEFEAGTGALSDAPDTEEEGHGEDNLMDGKPATFWASGGAADEVAMAFRAAGYGLSSIVITPGPTAYARPKSISITANSTVLSYTMEDKPVAQSFLLPVVIGYTGSAYGSIELEVVDSYPGQPGKGVAIAEVKLMAATIDEL